MSPSLQTISKISSKKFVIAGKIAIQRSIHKNKKQIGNKCTEEEHNSLDTKSYTAIKRYCKQQKVSILVSSSVEQRQFTYVAYLLRSKRNFQRTNTLCGFAERYFGSHYGNYPITTPKCTFKKKPSDVGLFLNRRFQYLKILLKQKRFASSSKQKNTLFIIKYCRAFILPR